MTHYTQYTVADLIELTSRLNAMLAATPFKSLKTILLKYSHQYVRAFLRLLLRVIYVVSQKLYCFKKLKLLFTMTEQGPMSCMLPHLHTLCNILSAQVQRHSEYQIKVN